MLRQQSSYNKYTIHRISSTNPAYCDLSNNNPIATRANILFSIVIPKKLCIS